MPVHYGKCSKCGCMDELEDTTCYECDSAQRVGFKNKYDYENALVDHLIDKYGYDPLGF